jgi:RNA polymerase sigma-54 factor
MNLGFEMNQGLEQHQVMSQKMIQAIKVLEMSNEELNAHIQEQLLENPILDWKEKCDRLQAYGKGQEDQLLTAHEELMIQWGVELKKQKLTKEQYIKLTEIGEKIIAHINAEGYLNKPIEHIARALTVSTENVENVVKKIQRLEPLGVGSRNLSEYLTIQLKTKACNTPALYELVKEENLEMLGKKRWQTLCDTLGITKMQLKEHVAIIKSLSPRIEFIKEQKTIEWVVPEIKVVEENNKLKVQWIEGRSPELFIPHYYLQLSKEKAEDEEVQEYVKTYIEKALWVINSIEERRKKTIEVAQYIVTHQKDYIMKESKSLKPLTQKQVAEDLKLSNSTVSRIVNKKYMETMSGNFELKAFFSHSVQKDKDVSQEQMKALIKNMIEKEDNSQPLSDDCICQNLGQKGIKISRRTVAKYRALMKIPNSQHRKNL